MNKIKRIQLISTGGTIEKTYDEIDGSLANRETVIKGILERFRHPYTEFLVSSIMSKDSLDMDMHDRETICKAVEKLANNVDGMVVLHGTDTLEQTAKLCFERLKNQIKIPVVFTGAMKPFGFMDSDAFQNLTEAIFAARLLSPGFYHAFHGKLFTVPNLRKNRQIKTFEEIQ